MFLRQLFLHSLWIKNFDVVKMHGTNLKIIVVVIWGRVTNFCVRVTGKLNCSQGHVLSLELWNCADAQITTIRFSQMKEILFEYTYSPLNFIKSVNIRLQKIYFSTFRKCVTIHYSGRDYANGRLFMNCTNAALWDVACRNFAYGNSSD